MRSWSSIRNLMALLCCVAMLVLACGRPAPAETPFLAAREGDLRSLKAMVNRDRIVLKQLDPLRCTLLHYAADGNQVAVIDYLLAEGAELEPLDVDQTTPLHHAARNGAFDALKRLVDEGADFRARQKIFKNNDNGISALDLAAKNGRWEIVKFLLEKGASADDPKQPIWPTALHRACGGYRANGSGTKMEGHRKAIDLLVKHVDINRSCLEKTPLHCAIERVNFEIVQHLLEKYPTIDVDVPSERGNTPLHLAVLSSKIEWAKNEDVAEMVRLLLRHGAKRDVQNFDDLTPLELARQLGKPQLIQLLSESP